MTDYASYRCHWCGMSFTHRLDRPRVWCTAQCADAGRAIRPSPEETREAARQGVIEARRAIWLEAITADGRLTIQGDETAAELGEAITYLYAV